MAKIKFQKSTKQIDVPNGTQLMRALLDHDIPVASSCFGKGICSKCRIQIVEGRENLSTESEFEISLRQRHNISNQFRISCQTEIQGDITIDTSYW